MFQFHTVLFLLAFSHLAPLLSVSGHGYVLEPPNRSSIWRIPEFADRHPPENYDDNQLFCGGYETQHNVNGGKCGVCGDPWNQALPRDNEDGGMYYKGIIVRRYKAGQVIPIEVQLTTTHLGYFDFRLCDKSDKASHLDQKCFDRHLLVRTNNSGTRYPVPTMGGRLYSKLDLILPKGVTCDHCVLQWTYTTGNRWGYCEDGKGALGCGPQETYRGCSDVSIMK